MSLGKKILKIGLIVTVTLFVSLSVVFLVFWTWPSVFINTKNLERVAGLLRPGIDLQWKTANLTASSISFFRKTISLDGVDFCVTMEASGVKACFTEASLHPQVDIKGWFPKYFLGPVRLTGGKIRIEPPPTPKEETPPDKNTEQIWPAPPKFFEDVTLETILVQIDRFDFITKDTKVGGKVTLTGTGKPSASAWSVKLDGEALTGKDKYRVDGAVDLQSQKSQWFGPYVINADLDANLPGKRSVAVQVRGIPKGDSELIYKVTADFRDNGKRFQGSVAGEASKSSLHAVLQGDAYNFIDSIPRVTFQTCKVEYGAKPKNPEVRHLDVNCPVTFYGGFAAERRTSLKKVDLDSVNLALKTALTIEDKPNAPGSVSGDVEILIDPLLRQVKHGMAIMKTKVEGGLADFPGKWKFDTDFKLEIVEFQKVVRMVQEMPFAVPEPFNSLHGAISLHVNGKGELAGEGGTLPIKFQTRLKGTKQTFNLDGDGELRLKKEDSGMKSHLKFNLALSDVKLLLPTLDMKAPPRIAPDDRIQVKPANKTKQPAGGESSFTYEITIATPKETPLRLSSNLAKADIPINISLKLGDKSPPTGAIRIESFPVELFRRVATVHHFDLSIAGKPNSESIDGEVRVVYSDYTIRILLMGLASEPQIKFVSEPPLPESEVVSLLLFGRTSQDLDSEQAASVGGARAAMADKALGLASMYLLASTPVESIGYDPANKILIAKVRLGDGTTLNVGSDARNLNRVGIRKQLGSNWSINTYLSDPLAPVNRSLTAFLEWSRGY